MVLDGINQGGGKPRPYHEPFGLRSRVMVGATLAVALWLLTPALVCLRACGRPGLFACPRPGLLICLRSLAIALALKSSTVTGHRLRDL